MNEHLRQKTILIVEDDKAIAELLQDLLSSEAGYQSIAVHDAAAALEFVRQLMPDLILTDVKLPGIDGITLMDMLRADELGRGVRIAFMTGSSSVPELAKRDIRKYLAKPFNLDEVLAFVAEALES